MTDLPRITVNAENIEFNALIDSGASRSLLSQEVYKEYS